MGWGSFRDKYVTPAAATVAGGPILGQVVGAGSGTFSDIPVVGDVVGGLTGQTAADAAREAAAVQSQAQQSQLDYLKDINALPQQYREEALTKLSDIYGGGPRAGFSVDQGALIEQAQMSPLYKQLLGGRSAGEEAILRQASATGGLRSGNVQEALYDYNVNLENQALTQAYNQALQDAYTGYQTGEAQYGQYLSGLQGLAGIEGYNPEIAQTIGNIGATQAAGITGAAQAQQQALQGLLGGGMNLATLALLA